MTLSSVCADWGEVVVEHFRGTCCAFNAALTRVREYVAASGDQLGCTAACWYAVCVYVCMWFINQVVSLAMLSAS
jgi:hypothetical protein